MSSTGCSQRRARSVNTFGFSSDGGSVTAAVDTTEFGVVLARHTALPVAEQDAIRLQAETKTEDWRRFETEAFREKDSRLRHWYYRYDSQTFNYFGVGMGNSITDLRDATRIDPSFAEGWSNLGRLCAEVGDLASGRKYLERALVAAEVQGEAGRPLDTEAHLEIFRNLAWTYRDLALWDEGLATIHAGLKVRRGDPELVLIKGLLLAGDGQYSAAVSLAVRMPPMEYPQFDFLHRGFQHQTSAYANNWIRSQALLADGDVEQAYRVLGDLDLYSYRSLLPYSTRYWRDAGLVAELAGDPTAPTYYSIGYVTRDYRQFYPLMAQNVAPQVLDVPNTHVPVFTSYGNRFFVGGSPLSYVGVQMNQMTQGLFAQQKSQSAGQALQMLEIMERRNIRPAICRALRGRVYYANDDFDLARTELTAARQAFAQRGEVDAGTSLLMGLLHMQANQNEMAQALLSEAATADPNNPVAWRSLGVISAQLGELEVARKAMDRAVALDPWTITSYYNRGLFHLQMKEFALARNDLERAFRLDPENREVQRLLQVAAAASRGRDPAGQAVTAQGEGPPPGFDANPEVLLAQLEAEVEAMFDLPDSLLVSNPEALAHFSELETRYIKDPTPDLRRLLALGYLNRGLDYDAQSILAPGWGVDLTPDEELMLLYADRNLGEVARAQQVVQEIMG
ncbi:MAG: tetratricopeptide repeat protein, partial [Candidatus Krumholzibacteria bacterium]|nr:tetratricopeptide repeat protein [Candidatus Krumholzibacteria bacterium]